VATQGKNICANILSLRIPFFFEPNFDANVAPFETALKLRPESVDRYSPVKYGDFLLNKVGNNFTAEKGKYD
jgi:isopenicillin N synthase-like dioxygenase